MVEYDLAIIGAGMAGASLAAEIAPHARVLLLEGEDAPGYHTTGRSAAFWEECYGGPELVPLSRASETFLREGGFLSPRGALYIGRAEDAGKLDAFAARFADSGARFDGLFFACDAMALGALEELASLGIAVPDQVGVIGFDGLGSGEFSAPPLTTVQPDFAQAGMSLVDTALASGEDRPERRVKVHLVERASVR